MHGVVCEDCQFSRERDRDLSLRRTLETGKVSRTNVHKGEIRLDRRGFTITQKRDEQIDHGIDRPEEQYTVQVLVVGTQKWDIDGLRNRSSCIELNMLRDQNRLAAYFRETVRRLVNLSLQARMGCRPQESFAPWTRQAGVHVDKCAV